MKRGQIVSVRLYGGSVVPRRVLVDRGAVVVICPEDEYQAASREEREPVGLGFPRQDVIDTAEESQRKSPTKTPRTARAQAGD